MNAFNRIFSFIDARTFIIMMTFYTLPYVIYS